MATPAPEDVGTSGCQPYTYWGRMPRVPNQASTCWSVTDRRSTPFRIDRSARRRALIQNGNTASRVVVRPRR
jgi:hypothetical protein